jgi:hypothetical protein
LTTLPQSFEEFRKALEWASKTDIFWSGRSDEGRHRKADHVWGELHIFRIVPVGVDEVRRVEVGSPTVTGLQDCLAGNRTVDFQLDMMSRSQKHANAAWYAATLAQTRIRAPFVRSKYGTPGEFALATVGPVIDNTDGRPFEGRQEDLAVLELSINVAMNETDEAMVGSWIETIEASTGFKKSGGTDLDSSLQLADEVMP